MWFCHLNWHCAITKCSTTMTRMACCFVSCDKHLIGDLLRFKIFSRCFGFSACNSTVPPPTGSLRYLIGCWNRTATISSLRKWKIFFDFRNAAKCILGSSVTTFWLVRLGYLYIHCTLYFLVVHIIRIVYSWERRLYICNLWKTCTSSFWQILFLAYTVAIRALFLLKFFWHYKCFGLLFKVNDVTM